MTVSTSRDRAAQRRLFRRRQLAVGSALGIALSLAATVSAFGWEGSTDVTGATGPTAAGGATPVFSVRRAPGWVGGATADRRLVAAVQPAVDSLPASSCAVVAPGGRVVASDNADKPFAPGSNMKILTARAALDVLGPTTTFRTDVLAAERPDGGAVAELWLVGGGDPLLSTEPFASGGKYGSDIPHTSFESLADAVVAAGVTTVGQIRADETRYDDVRTVATWPARYLADGQVGPLSALSLNDGRQFAASGPPAGTAPPAPDPAVYAAGVLGRLLTARGVEVGSVGTSGRAPKDPESIASVTSVPLTGIVAEMLTFSDNTTAEMLLKELGRNVESPGTTANGLKVLGQEAERLKLPMEGVVLVDGSGLDRGTRLRCDLLQQVLTDDGPEGPIASGLAVAARTGTLRDRYTKSPAAGRVRAKTGTLRDVTALSGWVDSPSGAHVGFAIIVNLDSGQVSDDDLVATQRVTEAALAYPDAPDRAMLGPR